jgi:hypothetical protein
MGGRKRRVGKGEETGSGAQSWQSGKLFLQSSELGLPQPLTRRQVCPPPFGSGGGTLACGRGGWGSPNSDEGTSTVVLYILRSLKVYAAVRIAATIVF